jgi:hypothetical protein
MVRMLIVGYCMGIRSERRLCEEVHLNLAYRWFCRLGLDGCVPDHSTFPKNRHGRFRDSDLLRELFETTVTRCMREGLVGGEGFAVDANMIKADTNRQRSMPGSEGLPAVVANRAAVSISRCSTRLRLAGPPTWCLTRPAQHLYGLLSMNYVTKMILIQLPWNITLVCTGREYGTPSPRRRKFGFLEFRTRDVMKHRGLCNRPCLTTPENLANDDLLENEFRLYHVRLCKCVSSHQHANLGG